MLTIFQEVDGGNIWTPEAEGGHANTREVDMKAVAGNAKAFNFHPVVFPLDYFTSARPIGSSNIVDIIPWLTDWGTDGMTPVDGHSPERGGKIHIVATSGEQGGV